MTVLRLIATILSVSLLFVACATPIEGKAPPQGMYTPDLSPEAYKNPDRMVERMNAQNADRAKYQQLQQACIETRIKSRTQVGGAEGAVAAGGIMGGTMFGAMLCGPAAPACAAGAGIAGLTARQARIAKADKSAACQQFERFDKEMRIKYKNAPP